MTLAAAAASEATGTAAGVIAGFSLSALDETRALALRADYLRTDVDMLRGQVLELHGAVRRQELFDRTLDKARMSITALLEQLAHERGMGWCDIAEALGVSVSAVRKWRKDGGASPNSRLKLARLAALLDVIERVGPIDDPAAWMEMDLPLGPGFFVRPWDLYLDGHLDALLDLAGHRRGAAQALDQVRPSWRESRSDFEVVPDADGEPSLRPWEK
ncbi:MAG: helix-turn-helix domain-containing protein [Actinomycetia bacterium]|nr:helix-turn-helix domain-containing protein [Actinomycetes bacterium]